MARPNVRNIKSLPDFATTYNWNIGIVTPASAVSGFPKTDDINFRAFSTTVPKAMNQPVEISIRGHKIKQPGILDYDRQITLTMVETVDSVVSKWISAWREACWKTVDGTADERESTEADLKIERLDRQDNTIQTLILYGCWLEDYDPTGGELGDFNPEAIKPNMTISYDYFKDEF